MAASGRHSLLYRVRRLELVLGIADLDEEVGSLLASILAADHHADSADLGIARAEPFPDGRGDFQFPEIGLPGRNPFAFVDILLPFRLHESPFRADYAYMGIEIVSPALEWSSVSLEVQCARSVGIRDFRLGIEA